MTIIGKPVTVQNFNSHPHKEDDQCGYLHRRQGSISTHILTRRMTHLLLSEPVLLCISTHILTRRMTQLLGVPYRPFLHFNSHPHKEDDQTWKETELEWDISTHILTRRMTLRFRCRRYRRNISTHILTRRMTGAG